MQVYYTTNNWCQTCTQSSTPSTSTKCCLRPCTVIIGSEDDEAVGPCGKQSSVDLFALMGEEEYCACGDLTPKFTVESYQENFFAEATVTPAGVLSWTTLGPEILELYTGQVIVKVCCGKFSAYYTVVIAAKDLCNCPGCNECENCDPCSGDCLDSEVNVNLTGQRPLSNTELNASV